MTTASAQRQDSLINEMRETLRVIEQFTQLLDLETDALRKFDFDTVDQLQSQKLSLARDYEAHVTALSTMRDDFKNTKSDLRDRIIMARSVFSKTLADNIKTLDAIKNSSKRLVNRILTAAREAAHEPHSYGARGHLDHNPKTTVLSIDQNI